MKKEKMRNKNMIIDRIPRQFCEGPFWGNGQMGAVMYVEQGHLCVSIDHIGLWELRETLPDNPKATFDEILQHKEEYLKGNPKYVEDTWIFQEHIGRTRLPALAIALELPGEITDFRAETDMETAKTTLCLELDHEKLMEGTIWIDSLSNILFIKLQDGFEKELHVHALGWDLDSPRLKTLKDWNYEPCFQKETEEGFVVRQHFGADMTAILTGQIRKMEDGLQLAVGINTGCRNEEKIMEQEGTKQAAGYLENIEEFRKKHEEDWKNYWEKFDICIPNDRLQEAFYQEMFKLYCNERENSSPVTLQGIWNPNNRMPAWYGDLHNDLNVQSCYWPAYKTGNVNLVRPYVDYYAAAMPRFEERAWKLFGIKDAIHVPTMMAPDGTGAASEWCYWNTILGPELFVAVDFTWFYEYSKENDTLRDKIYPFVEKVIHLYQGIAVRKEDGYYHIPFTSSPEVDRDGSMLMADDSTFTLSCLHYLCRKMKEYAKILGKDGKTFEEWERNLMPVVTNKKGFPVFDGIDVFESHRHFCQLYPVYPLCEEAHNEVTNLSLDTAVNQGFLEYAAFSFPYMGIMAARCGRGNMCRTMLEIYCMVFRSRNSFTVNGDPYQNGVLRVCDTNAGESSDAFTLESGFFVPTTLCEMFAHRSNNDVWLLMGMPDEWKESSAHGITVEGGHKIDVEMENYHLKKAVIHGAWNEQLIIHWKDSETLWKLYKNGEEIPFVQGRQCTIFVNLNDVWELIFTDGRN